MTSTVDPLNQILATLTNLQQQNALLNQKVPPYRQSINPLLSSWNNINCQLNNPSLPSKVNWTLSLREQTLHSNEINLMRQSVP